MDRTNCCAIHGKNRVARYLQKDATGRYICKAGHECKERERGAEKSSSEKWVGVECTRHDPFRLGGGRNDVRPPDFRCRKGNDGGKTGRKNDRRGGKGGKGGKGGGKGGQGGRGYHGHGKGSMMMEGAGKYGKGGPRSAELGPGGPPPPRPPHGLLDQGPGPCGPRDPCGPCGPCPAAQRMQEKMKELEVEMLSLKADWEMERRESAAQIQGFQSLLESHDIPFEGTSLGPAREVNADEVCANGQVANEDTSRSTSEASFNNSGPSSASSGSPLHSPSSPDKFQECDGESTQTLALREQLEAASLVLAATEKSHGEELQEMQAKLQSMEQANADLAKQLEERDRAREETDQVIAAKERENEEERAKCVGLHQKLQEAANEASAQSHREDLKEQEMQSKLRALEEANADLAQQVQERDQSLKEAEQANSALQQELEEAKRLLRLAEEAKLHAETSLAARVAQLQEQEEAANEASASESGRGQDEQNSLAEEAAAAASADSSGSQSPSSPPEGPRLEKEKKNEEVVQALKNCGVVRMLGEGTSSVAWLFEKGGSFSVFKQPRNEDAKKSLLYEASVLQQLSHPNILSVVGVQSGLPLFQFCEDGDLFEVCQSDEVEEVFFYKLLGSCLDAVDYLHARSIMHRDLKPENIFRRAEASLLGDFELAVYMPEGYAYGIVGTDDYRAPEVTSGMFYSTPADVWSVGATFAWMWSRVRSKVNWRVEECLLACSQVEPMERPPASEFRDVTFAALAEGRGGQ